MSMANKRYTVPKKIAVFLRNHERMKTLKLLITDIKPMSEIPDG